MFFFFFSFVLKSLHLSTFPVELVSLTLVKRLDLSFNDLSELPPSLASMSSLRHLILTGNHFVKFPLVLLSMSDLHTIALGRNSLTEIPGDLGKMAELRELDLFMNKLRSVIIREPAPKLHTLLLRANRLSELSATLVGLTALTHLDISSNKIESLLPLADMERLTKLECSSCTLSNLQVFTVQSSLICKTLVFLNVSCNRQITAINDFQTPNLTELRAMNCSIERIASKLQSCIKLRILDLDGNPLRAAMLECPRLEVLAMCGSKLNQFPEILHGNLIELATANTHLRKMPSVCASSFTDGIKRLYLQGNKIAELSVAYLQSLTVSEQK